MEEIHYRIILKNGKRAAEAHRQICSVYGDDALNLRTYQNWFARCYSGNFDINDAQRLGRPHEIETSNVKAIFNQNSTQSMLEIAMALSKCVAHKCRKSFAQVRLCFSRLDE